MNVIFGNWFLSIFCLLICHYCLISLKCPVNKDIEEKNYLKLVTKSFFIPQLTTNAGLTLQVCNILMGLYQMFCCLLL